MTGYKAVKLARKEPNRGSVIWVRGDLVDRMVRVYAPKEEDSGYNTANKHLWGILRNWKTR